MPEDDPDILQLLDESDADWVKLWRTAAKQDSNSNSVTFVVPQMHKQKHKTR